MSPRRPSARAFAERTGLSRTTIRDGLNAGRVPSAKRNARGDWELPDLETAVREWHASAAKPSPGPTLGESLSQAQRGVHLERARQLRLANLQKEGRLIDRDLARRQSFEAARTVRDAILNVPDRIAAELAAETDPGRVHRRLEDELRKALVSLAEALDDSEPAALDAADGDLRAAG